MSLLMVWFRHSGDQHRCQTALDKVSEFAKIHGNRLQLKRALEARVPDGPFYEFLEGRLPHPSFTFVTLAEIVEAEENERISKEIGERRTRLGARISQVTSEVKLEVYNNSPLEELYQKVIDWHLDDDIRRQYEEKLLLRAHDTLMVLPREEKLSKLEKVMKIANGMVILKHPFLLAWQIVLEWKEIEYLNELDRSIIRDFIDIFPNDNLCKTLRWFLSSPVSPFEHDEGDKGSGDGNQSTEPLISLAKVCENRHLSHMLISKG